MELIEKVENFINKNELLSNGDRIVVGVSGGPDSLCLLCILNELKEKYNLTLFIVHINHMLREEADFEEEFVRNFSKKMEIEFYSTKANIKELAKEQKKSTEEIAREIRYTFFNKIAEETKSNKIAVAHNANDNAETVLLNLLRGSGIEGLKGIEPAVNKIIRPLLEIERDEIEKYCKQKKLNPMIDKSNFETLYTRNKVRNKVIPYLKEINSNIINSLNRLSNIISDEEKFINGYIERIYNSIKTENGLNKDKFMELEIGLKRRILRKEIEDFCGSLKDVTFAGLENAIKIIDSAKNGDIIVVSEKVKFKINYNVIERIIEKKRSEKYIYEIKIPGTTYIKECNSKIITEIVNANDTPDIIKEKNKKIFDIDKTGEKLYVRSRREGDFFYPTGMVGKKKIKDFFSDEKVATELRDKIPIICNEEEIVWVVGMRSSRKFLKDKMTKEVIIIYYGENI